MTAVGLAAAAVSARAIAFEQALGDPHAESSATGFAAAVARDDRGEFPDTACAALDAAGLRDAHLAAASDPSTGCEPLMWMLRLAARRDVTAAFCHASSCVAALPVLSSDRVAWKHEAIDVVRRGGWIGLAAGPETLHAITDGSDCVLTGAADCCLHADRTDLLVVRARSAGGDLLAVVDTASARDRVFPGERLKSLGICGAGFGSVHFAGARVPRPAVLAEGPAAAALAGGSDDAAVVAMASLAIGAADTGLRAAAAFARDRRMYGGTVFDIPHARSLLTGVLLDLLACECVVLTAVRALCRTDPDARFWCEVTGAFVFDTTADLLQDLAVVLGARYYLREGHWHGIFEKIVRDHFVLEALYGAPPERLAAFGASLRDLPPDPQIVDGVEFWARLEREYGDRWMRAPEVVELGRTRAIHAALGVLRQWLDGAAGDTREILHACVSRLLARLEPGAPAPDSGRLLPFLMRALEENRLFSTFDVPLPPSIAPPHFQTV